MVNLELVLQDLAKETEVLHNLEKEKQDTRSAIETSQNEAAMLSKRQQDLESEITSLKQQIDDNIAGNEQDYQLTCEALKTLHDLHATDVQLQCRIETVSLSCTMYLYYFI